MLLAMPTSCSAPGGICSLEKWNSGPLGSHAGKKLGELRNHKDLSENASCPELQLCGLELHFL